MLLAGRGGSPARGAGSPGQVSVRCPLNEAGDPEVAFLGRMKQIVFLDLDNWPKLFNRLPGPMPDRTFVWAFYGGATQWREPSM